MHVFNLFHSRNIQQHSPRIHHRSPSNSDITCYTQQFLGDTLHINNKRSNASIGSGGNDDNSNGYPRRSSNESTRIGNNSHSHYAQSNGIKDNVSQYSSQQLLSVNTSQEISSSTRPSSDIVVTSSPSSSVSSSELTIQSIQPPPASFSESYLPVSGSGQPDEMFKSMPVTPSDSVSQDSWSNKNDDDVHQKPDVDNHMAPSSSQDSLQTRLKPPYSLSTSSVYNIDDEKHQPHTEKIQPSTPTSPIPPQQTDSPLQADSRLLYHKNSQSGAYRYSYTSKLRNHSVKTNRNSNLTENQGAQRHSDLTSTGPAPTSPFTNNEDYMRSRSFDMADRPRSNSFSGDSHGNSVNHVQPQPPQRSANTLPNIKITTTPNHIPKRRGSTPSKSKRIASFFKRSKEQHPDYIKALQALDAMKFNEAVSLFTKALIQYPTSYSIRCDRAYASYQVEDWDRSLNDLNNAILRKPKKPRAYSLRGEVYRLLRDNSKALYDLNKALKIQKNAFSLRARSEVFHSMRKYEDALRDLNDALELEPMNIYTLTRRAKVYCSLNQYGNALDDLGNAMKLDESNAPSILANRGEIYRTIGRNDLALKDLNLSLQSEENTMALERRGRVYRSLNRESEALADFERILQLNPRSFFAHKNKAEILHSLGNLDEALTHMNIALQIEPNHFSLLKCRGEVYQAQRYYDKAIQDFNSALKVDPKSADVLRSRGEIYRLLQDFNNSLGDFTKSLEIEPKNVFALSRRGEVYRMLKQGAKAIQDLDEAIRLESENIMARESRGAVNRTFRRYEEALRDLDEAIFLNPDSIFALTNRGAVYYMLKRHYESLMDLKKALKLDPNHVFALETRGALYNALGRFEEGLADLNASLELDPTNVWALTYRGETLLALGRYDEALKDLNKVLEGLPDWGYPLALRGIVYRMMKSYTKATLDLDRALQNMKDKAFNIDYETKALCNRGIVHRILGKNHEAVRDFNKALLREPNNILALCERSKVYEVMGRKEKAKADIEYILKVDPINEYALERTKKYEEQA